jgi:putative hydroxymethylpyrimidine transport system substrate-binding protein
MGVLLAAVTLALASTACGGGKAPSASSTTPLRVLLDWFPNPDHAGFYTAQDRGFFRDQGLDVSLTPPSDPADPLKLVAAGQVPLGVSYQPDVISAREQGLHVIAVAAVIPVALNSLLAPKTSPVKSPVQLAGHTIGTTGLPSDDLYLNQIYAKFGVNSRSVKKVNVSTNLVSAMLSKNVDATIGGYRNIEAVQLRDQGLDPMVVPVTDAGVPDYDELVLIANSDKLATDQAYQQNVRRFIAGLAKGTQEAIAQPAVATQSMQKAAKAFSADLTKKMVEATLPLLVNPQGFGHLDKAAWQSFADWMLAHGSLSKAVSASTAVTNDYLAG